MSRQQEWIPAGVDISAPSVARVYDFLLGGGHNFAVDRETAERAERHMPGARLAARVNRAFLGRVVRFMMAQGIRQFLDIGSGIPTAGNVHEIAQRVDPDCRVVYVDRDPIAVAHSELMLTGNDHAAVVRADMRDPDSILASPPVRRLIDLGEPVGLLLLLIVHWIPDESDPLGLLSRYRYSLASGSFLALTHMTGDDQTDEVTEASGVLDGTRSPDRMTLRSYDEVMPMFGDFQIVQPGLVGCALWRPGGPADITDDARLNSMVYAGVGRKP